MNENLYSSGKTNGDLNIRNKTSDKSKRGVEGTEGGECVTATGLNLTVMGICVACAVPL